MEDKNLAAGVDTASEMVSGVCFGNGTANCHSAASLGSGYKPGDVKVKDSVFHNWTGVDPLHASPAISYMGLWNTTATNPRTTNMLVTSAANLKGVLPFWSSPSALLDARTYTPSLGYYINCLSCHDPHGTSLNYWDFRNSGVAPDTAGATKHTRGMIRDFPVYWWYHQPGNMGLIDPLCGQCHWDPAN
jgi:hypothetical protein